MTEPVTPKAERRVIDGEVVEPTVDTTKENTSNQSRTATDTNARRRAHNRTQKTTESSSSANSKATDNKVKKASVMSKPWVRKSLLWGSFFIMVAAILFYTRPNMDWQVEHINRLQVEVAKLQESNQSLADQLQKQQTELDARISEVQSKPENQPLITQVDLEALKTDTQMQLTSLYEQVQTDLTAFNSQAQSKLQALAEQATTLVAPSEPDLTALTEFQQKIEGQLSEVGEEISQLLTFKQEQEQQQQQEKSPSEAQPESASVQPLSRMQIQQWMVEINNQWLLKGDVELTQNQLLAFEQALAMTQVANKTEIARTIGQDLSEIKAYSEQIQQANQSVKKELEALNILMNAIPQPDMTRQAPVTASALQDNAQETRLTASPLETLLEKFSGLISVKKRDSEGELSSVEGLLLHDVLMQRLALLVDRVDWAISIQSTAELRKAVASLQAFIDLHFKAQSQAFKAVLAPLNSIEFSQRAPLSVVSLNAV